MVKKFAPWVGYLPLQGQYIFSFRLPPKNEKLFAPYHMSEAVHSFTGQKQKDTQKGALCFCSLGRITYEL